MTTRRGFLAGILAAGFAPAAVGSGILMPVKNVKKFVLPDEFLFKRGTLGEPGMIAKIAEDFDGDVLNFGKLPWRPELVLSMPLSKVLVKDVIVSPRFRRVVGMPVIHNGRVIEHADVYHKTDAADSDWISKLNQGFQR